MSIEILALLWGKGTLENCSENGKFPQLEKSCAARSGRERKNLPRRPLTVVMCCREVRSKKRKKIYDKDYVKISL